jgi:hypothetical protein
MARAEGHGPSWNRGRHREARMGNANETPSIEEVIKDPVKHYRAPREVVADSRFTRDERRRILESWALDAQLITVADEENMAAPQRPWLREVKLALIELERSR